jgi:hypothetical protein
VIRFGSTGTGLAACQDPLAQQIQRRSVSGLASGFSSFEELLAFEAEKCRIAAGIPARHFVRLLKEACRPEEQSPRGITAGGRAVSRSSGDR